jgi:hypothetical protein
MCENSAIVFDKKCPKYLVVPDIFLNTHTHTHTHTHTSPTATPPVLVSQPLTEMHKYSKKIITLYPDTRTLYSDTRTLYSDTRTLYSDTRTLYSDTKALYSSTTDKIINL